MLNMHPRKGPVGRELGLRPAASLLLTSISPDTAHLYEFGNDHAQGSP